jgi:hypothetical protein
MGRLGFGRVTGAGLDIGTSIMTKYGDDLAKVAIKSGKLADDAASIATFKSQKIIEINKSVIKRLDNFTNKLSKADASKLIGMGKTLREQSAKYGQEMAATLGDPKIADDITKAMGSKVTGIYKGTVKKSQKNLIGKTADDIGTVGIKTADDLPSGPFNKLANGTWGAAKRNPGKIVIAGIMFGFWSGGLDFGAGLLQTLETIGFLPAGTTGGFISLWGKIRGFISFVITGALILGTFYIANIVFGAAKTAKGVVDSVSDNIVPDAKPSGA